MRILSLPRRRAFWTRPLLKAVGFIAGAALLCAVTAFAVILFRPSSAKTQYTISGGSAEAPILHLRASRIMSGAKGSSAVQIEAWLDENTKESKLVETAGDGTLRRVETFSRNSYMLYLGDANHVVIRRGLNDKSPFVNQIHDDLFRYSTSLQRGAGQVVSTGYIGDKAIKRVRVTINNMEVLADIAADTGLTLREEMTGPGGTRESRETVYTTAEYVSHASLGDAAFLFTPPANSSREEYQEDQPSRVGENATGLPYKVYAAPVSLGVPTTSFRRASEVPGKAAADVYYLIYSTSEGVVQILSSLPPDATSKQDKGPLPNKPGQLVQIGEEVWEIAPNGSGIQGRTVIADTYITIYAPSQASFALVARGLRIIEP